MTPPTPDRPPDHPADHPAGMLPRRFRVVSTRRDTRDTHTLALTPLDGSPLAFAPGQFTMLLAFGVGEVPISISGDPARPELLHHTIRDVGSVSHALATAAPGAVLGVRGPFGTGWEAERGRGGDVVIVAGGIGLAPLRPSILQIAADRGSYGRVLVLYGARNPEEILYAEEQHGWAERHDIDVEVIVDSGAHAWRGRVGLVTELVERATFDAADALGLVCGPEVMMRHSARALVDRGVAPARVRLSMERTMQCGIGLCGHCQLRELFCCLDGPVLGYDRLASLMTVAEL
ncbi:FAD/NAD(P)-binding protein [Nocardioides sp.]|uniref:FAD/NAD(P)-binding protein n=1 Tax=Nocardioides sp. TaxID=35761 RepID=UPI002735031F|nr:FAD/NAD(P)-binding protein [Nocardioides sp.]MDP3894206.1 FAD/NAD(P)-binding protein [Nocardioides sp.]